VQYDPTKFTWIGSANDEVSVCVAWHTSGVSKFEDVLTKELTVGSTGLGDDTYQFPRFVNNVLGTKFKMITGYPGGNDVSLALERGEVGGRCGWSWSSVKSIRMAWVTEKKINLLMQFSLAKHPDLPEVPLIMDLARNDEQRQMFRLIFARQVMGRPFQGPPGIPADRLRVLQKAFMDTMKDKEFLAEAEKAQFEITPVSGEDIEKLLAEVFKTPAALAEKAGTLVK
jgi:tripartite-type tricarboxylate transporter receptor subunit TctC